jgi:hypothetical protein
LPINKRFPDSIALAFPSEFLPFSKGIETCKILSRIPPWAAISTRSYKTPAESKKATYVESYVGWRFRFYSEISISHFEERSIPGFRSASTMNLRPQSRSSQGKQGRPRSGV